MFDSIKLKIAKIIVTKRMKEIKYNVQSFGKIFSQSRQLFLIMPVNETDFKSAISLVQTFEANGRSAIILSKDFMLGFIPQKLHHKVITFGIEDINWFGLPSKKLMEKLSQMNFDAVIDLNRKPDLFCSYAANLVNTILRVGIKKTDSDLFYNLQFENTFDEPDFFYKNFLNSLNMF